MEVSSRYPRSPFIQRGCLNVGSGTSSGNRNPRRSISSTHRSRFLGAEAHVNDIMVIRLQQMLPMIRHDVQVVPNGPSEDCGAEQQGHESVVLGS